MSISRDGCRTLGLILRNERKVQVECTVCREFRRFTREDIEALAEKVGMDFSLLNRRCRCRLTPGCPGWNRFFFEAGVYHPLFTPECADAWMVKDWRERMRGGG